MGPQGPRDLNRQVSWAEPGWDGLLLFPGKFSVPPFPAASAQMGPLNPQGKDSHLYLPLGTREASLSCSSGDTLFSALPLPILCKLEELPFSGLSARPPPPRTPIVSSGSVCLLHWIEKIRAEFVSKLHHWMTLGQSSHLPEPQLSYLLSEGHLGRWIQLLLRLAGSEAVTFYSI